MFEDSVQCLKAVFAPDFMKNYQESVKKGSSALGEGGGNLRFCLTFMPFQWREKYQLLNAVALINLFMVGFTSEGYQIKGKN